MTFHLGKPILAMLLIAALSGLAILLRPAPPPPADLTLWVFDADHAKTYRDPLIDFVDDTGSTQRESLLEAFHRKTGKTVAVVLLNQRAEDFRLQSAFTSGLPSATTPDLAEIEIQSVGKFFRPPPQDIGFASLNSDLAHSPLKDQILPERLAPWTRSHQIYGLPHDVHPVSLTYRADLFAEAGIDLEEKPGEKPLTWPQFQSACLQFQDYWRSRGYPHRHAIELSSASSDSLEIILLQRHLNMIDADNQIHLGDPKTAQTLAFYAQLVAGPRAIAGHASNQRGAETQDLEQGNLCALLTPDWRISDLEKNTPSLAGRLRMRPLPIFDAADAPTSTWGGTMLAILKSSPHPDLAWQFAQFIYFSPEALEARRQQTDILPPLKSAWADSIYQRPDPFFGDQKIAALYVRLANQIPDRNVSPATPIASAILSYALQRAGNYLDRQGSAGLEPACQSLLHDAALDLQRRIDHAKWEETEDDTVTQ